MTEQRMCKGSIILDLVKVVKGFKDLPWSDYLQPQDLELVHGLVIPTEWYSMESYRRLGLAVFKLVAKGNAQAAAAFGRASLEAMLDSPYRFHLERKNPFEAVQKFMDLRRPLFNFSRWTVQKTGDQSLTVRVTEFGEFGPGMELFLLVLGACLQGLIECNGGRDVKLQSLEQGDPHDRALVFDLRWT